MRRSTRPTDAPALPSRQRSSRSCSAPTMPRRIVVVNGRWSTALVDLARCRAGVTRRQRCATCPARIASDATAGPADAVRGAEHRVLRGRASSFDIAPKAVVAEPIHVLFVSASGRRIRSWSRRGSSSSPASRRRCRSSRATPALGASVIADQRRHRGRRRRGRRSSITSRFSASSRRVPRRRRMIVRLERAGTFASHADHVRRPHRAQRHRRGARRRRRRVHAERPVRRRRRRARRQPHDDRPRAAALPEPRGLQGHPGRPRRAPSSTARSSSGRTRRRPTRSRPTRRCCSPTTRRSTRSRSSRSSPTT